MRSQETYEMLVTSACLTLLGLEFTGFSSWYYIKVMQDPFQVFRQTLVITIPLAAFIFFVAWAIGKTSLKERAEIGIALPETKSFIQYLKFSRAWILIGGVVVMPIVLTLMVWLALRSNDPGFARRDPRNMMVYLIGLGPIFTLIGVSGMVYTFIKRHVR